MGFRKSTAMAGVERLWPVVRGGRAKYEYMNTVGELWPGGTSQTRRVLRVTSRDWKEPARNQFCSGSFVRAAHKNFGNTKWKVSVQSATSSTLQTSVGQRLVAEHSDFRLMMLWKGWVLLK